MLFRMQKHGKVEVEIEMTNSFGDKPMDVYNTVAEIRGSEKPDEVVILGAHLDSWTSGPDRRITARDRWRCSKRRERWRN